MKKLIQKLFIGMLLFSLGCSSHGTSQQEQNVGSEQNKEAGHFLKSTIFKMVLTKQQTKEMQ